MDPDPLAVLLALAFAPAVLYLGILAWRHPGPSLGRALAGFAYGATLSLVVLVGLYALLLGALGNDPTRLLLGPLRSAGSGDAARDFALVVVVAPLLEEAAKGAGVVLLGARLRVRGDGVLLGASVGLGFAAVETFLYLLAAWGDGSGGLAGATFVSVLVLAGARSVTSALVHPAATGLTGYGVALGRLRGTPVLLAALPFYLLAVALHGAYNYLAAFLPPQDLGGFAVEVNLPAAVLLAALAWGAVKRGVASRA